MYIALDLILAVVMVFTVVRAAHRGFIVTIFHLLSTVAAIILAVMFYKQLGVYLYDRFIFPYAYGYIEEMLAKIAESSAEALNFETILANLPESISAALGQLGLELPSSIPATGTEVLTAATDSFAETIATALANILAFAAIFFGAFIALQLVSTVLNQIAKLPVLNATNRLLGLLLGVCEALILGVALSYVAVTLCSAYGAVHTDFPFANVAENTYIASFLYRLCP